MVVKNPVPAVSGVSVGVDDALSSRSSSCTDELSSPPWWRGTPPAPNWDQDVRVPCRNARLFNGIPAGCGTCIACRARKAKSWGVRLQLEMAQHAESLFVTLTYDVENLPAEGSLYKKQLSEYLKRVRSRIHHSFGRKLRFFGCGEYGTRTGRAHYHVLLFGVGMWAHRHVAEAWPFGFSHIKPADPGAGMYVAGYVVKKLTAQQREGREPEFLLMSRRPGIGAGAADRLAELGLKHAMVYDDYGDVISVMKKGPFNLGIAGYVQNRVRKALTGSANVPANKKRAKAEAVYAVQMAAAEAGERPNFSHSVKALQVEKKFLRSRQNETF